MKCKKGYLLVFILFTQLWVHAQLNEFMVQWYFSEGNASKNVPWRDINNSITSGFFNDMKNNYHFNTVYFHCFGISQFYTVAKNIGLNTILSEIPSQRDTSGILEFDKDDIQIALNTYGSSSYSVIGYNITDEPSTSSACDKLGKCYNLIEYIPLCTNAIRDKDKTLLRYANLFPVFPATPYEQIPADDWFRETYYQKYIDIASPNLLSFDHYPIYDQDEALGYGLGETFFSSLYNIGMKSVENSIPFIYVLTPLRTHADLFTTVEPPNDVILAASIPHFNYCIYAALAYGAKGISYWNGFQWVKAADTIAGKEYNFKLKDSEGAFNYLGSLHQKLINHSNVLLSLNFASAYHVSVKSTISAKSPKPDENIHEFSKWSHFANDKYANKVFNNTTTPVRDLNLNGIVPPELAVTFLTNKNGQIYFWLFNKSIDRDMILQLNLNYDVNDVLNDETIMCTNGYEDYVTLEPGEGKLFTSAINNLPFQITNLTISNALFNNGFYPYESASSFINIGQQGTAYSVIFNSGTTKSFGAKYINIHNTKFTSGSNIRIKAYTDCNSITELRSASVTDEVQIDSLKESSIKEFDAKIYPNPTKDNFMLHVDLKRLEQLDVSINDAMGKSIRRLKISSPDTQISLKGYPSGVYFLRFVREDKVCILKVIKI